MNHPEANQGTIHHAIFHEATSIAPSTLVITILTIQLLCLCSFLASILLLLFPLNSLKRKDSI